MPRTNKRQMKYREKRTFPLAADTMRESEIEYTHYFIFGIIQADKRTEMDPVSMPPSQY